MRPAARSLLIGVAYIALGTVATCALAFGLKGIAMLMALAAGS
jgi:hypothetical protein